jgi:hypothetical protein
VNLEHTVDEVELREVLDRYARAAIPEGTDLRRRIRARVSQPRRRVLRWPARWGWAVAAAALAVVVSAGAALALVPQNRQVVINFVTRSEPPRVDSHGPTVSHPLGAPAGATASAADVARVQRQAGFKVVLASGVPGARLAQVEYWDWVRDDPLAPSSPHGGVHLVYRVGANVFNVLETRDARPAGSPLQVTVPSNLNRQGTAAPQVETIAGSPYAVVRTTDGSRIAWALFETQGGVRVTVLGNGNGNGTDAKAFIDLITHMS